MIVDPDFDFPSTIHDPSEYQGSAVDFRDSSADRQVHTATASKTGPGPGAGSGAGGVPYVGVPDLGGASGSGSGSDSASDSASDSISETTTTTTATTTTT